MHKSSHNSTLARAQRKAPSLPEGLLWRELRGRAGSVKFRRQPPVGRIHPVKAAPVSVSGHWV